MEKVLFSLIIIFIVFEFVVEQLLDFLNKKAWADKVPNELSDIYDAEKFEQHKKYRVVNNRFSSISDGFSFILTLAVLLFGVFALVDAFAFDMFQNPIGRGLLFFAIIGGVSSLLQLPFGWYSTFVIEQKFGFNNTTPKIFWGDTLKGWLLALIIGGPLMALMMWFYQQAGDLFWIYAWMLIGCLTIFMSMFYTSLILPLFNKQSPLEAGGLRDAIETFSKRAGFHLDNVYVMDGSKRSTKANAFFSGLGSRKRIVLFDTLINDLTTEEIVAVLAHEVGHYKLKHTLWGTIAGILQMGVLLFLFSLFVSSPQLSQALGVEGTQFHIGLLAFGLLFTPVSLIIGLFMNALSRHNEYAADHFASVHTDGEALIRALKKLSANSLGNPTPHAAYVWFHYSHPSLLQRIKALRESK